MDDILLTKVCNAFRPTVTALDAHERLDEFAIRINFSRDTAAHATNSAIGRYQEKHGVWVGGRVFVTQKAIFFSPNAINKAIHASNHDFDIQLCDIKSVECVFGFVSGIIVITTLNALYKIRCFNAKNTAKRINQIINN